MTSKYEYASKMCTSEFGWKLKNYTKFEYAMEKICEILIFCKVSNCTGYVSIGTQNLLKVQKWLSTGTQSLIPVLKFNGRYSGGLEPVLKA